MRWWQPQEIKEINVLWDQGMKARDIAAEMARRHPKKLAGCTKNMIIGVHWRWVQEHMEADQIEAARQEKLKKEREETERRKFYQSLQDARNRRQFGGKCVFEGCSNTAQPGRDYCAGHNTRVKVNEAEYKNRTMAAI